MRLSQIRSDNSGFARVTTESGDALAVYSFLALTTVGELYGVGFPARAVAGLALVTLVPGYGVVLALFPRRGRPLGLDGRAWSVDGLERLALAFGASLTLAPLVGLALGLVGLPLTRRSVTLGLVVVAAVAVTLGEWRRRRLPREEWFSVPLDRFSRLVERALGDGGRSPDTVLNVTLALSVAFALTMLATGVLAPADGERYTDVYLATQSGGGELVAGDYPVNLSAAARQGLVVGLDNHERRPVTYHVVVQFQHVREGETAADERVERRTRVAHRAVSVPTGGTWEGRLAIDLPVTPAAEAVDCRLVYLFYRDEAPADPTTANAYRSLYVWVEATGADGAATVDSPASERVGFSRARADAPAPAIGAARAG